ncbi:hypothetical protein CRM22_008036 [Opisthorchis felineus]|uniref:Cytochrome b561 domain-containing protein n=1 Tax=Opisthorchis felineus TaxID=147828 RepID=A0A4S2LDM7_OPIFE|nr:hypothetical protein CRM22_008036 [Opisthorchis felineus]
MLKISNKVLFWIAFVFAQICGLVCVILAGVWGGLVRGGFDWNSSINLMNFHILFMTIGFVFLYGFAILIFRVAHSAPKMPLKIAHAVILILALVFAAVGLRAAYEKRKDRPPIILYSVHSWLGILVFIGFGLQWVVGFAFFLIPQTPIQLRSIYLPFHTIFGPIIYGLIILVCLTGITEVQLFFGNYQDLHDHAMIGNFLGLFIVFFGALVFFLVTYSPFRRVEVTPTKDVSENGLEPVPKTQNVPENNGAVPCGRQCSEPTA